MIKFLIPWQLIVGLKVVPESEVIPRLTNLRLRLKNWFNEFLDRRLLLKKIWREKVATAHGFFSSAFGDRLLGFLLDILLTTHSNLYLLQRSSSVSWSRSISRCWNFLSRIRETVSPSFCLF